MESLNPPPHPTAVSAVKTRTFSDKHVFQKISAGSPPTKHSRIAAPRTLNKASTLGSLPANLSTIISPHPIKPFFSSMLDLERASSSFSPSLSSLQNSPPLKKSTQSSSILNPKCSRISLDQDLARKELLGIFSCSSIDIEPFQRRSKSTSNTLASPTMSASSCQLERPLPRSPIPSPTFAKLSPAPSPVYRAANPLPLDNSFNVLYKAENRNSSTRVAKLEIAAINSSNFISNYSSHSLRSKLSPLLVHGCSPSPTSTSSDLDIPSRSHTSVSYINYELVF